MFSEVPKAVPFKGARDPRTAILKGLWTHGSTFQRVPDKILTSQGDAVKHKTKYKLHVDRDLICRILFLSVCVDDF